MSHALYWTVLSWHNGVGEAKLHGNQLELCGPPDLGSGPVHFVEYVPEVSITLIAMTPGERIRGMNGFETRAADELLRAAKPIACHYSDDWKEGRC